MHVQGSASSAAQQVPLKKYAPAVTEQQLRGHLDRAKTKCPALSSFDLAPWRRLIAVHRNPNDVNAFRAAMAAELKAFDGSPCLPPCHLT